MQKILNTLDALDRHSFERVDLNNSIDTLYNSIFPPIPEKLSNSSTSSGSIRFNSKPNSVNVNQVDGNKKDYVRTLAC